MACVLSSVVTGQIKESVAGTKAIPSPLSALVVHESNVKFSSWKPLLRVVPTMVCEWQVHPACFPSCPAPMHAEESCRLGTCSCGGLRPYAQSGALSGSFCGVPLAHKAGVSLTVKLAPWLL